MSLKELVKTLQNIDELSIDIKKIIYIKLQDELQSTKCKSSVKKKSKKEYEIYKIKCSKCNKRTSTTNEKFAKLGLCSECRTNDEEEQSSLPTEDEQSSSTETEVVDEKHKIKLFGRY